MRIQFNDGQEVTSADFNDLQAAVEGEIYDRVISELFLKVHNAFLGNGFKVGFVDASHVSLTAGVGFQYDSTQVEPEPVNRMLYLPTASNVTITPPNSTSPRIDIVCVQAARGILLSEPRRYKADTASAPSVQEFVTQTDWIPAIQVVAGTPSGSPVAPATPAGFLRIASITVAASTGIQGAGSITDERSILDAVNPNTSRTWTGSNTYSQGIILSQIAAASIVQPGSGKAAYFLDTDGIFKSKDATGSVRPIGGSPDYDSIVGSTASATHSSLATSIAAAQPGWRILVLETQTLNSPVTVSQANIEIVMKPAAALAKGTSTGALVISGAGFKLRGGLVSGFSGVSDTAISVQAGATSAMLRDIRFTNNTVDLDDANGLASVQGCVNE